MMDFEAHPWKTLCLVAIGVAVVAYAAIGVYTVEGTSMIPNISPGDRVVIYRWGKIRKGDVVILTLPDTKSFAIKRVVGTAGDTISHSKGFIHIAEQSLPLRSEAHPAIATAGVVPVKSYFVAGDLLYESIDSRDYGFISRDSIRGRVLDFRRR
ncbi:MAG: signal peptidase I [Spirochaetales bacterium]|nr:signal peptidase I [Spirochaetales bacterium]